jgi:hypothetical protein
MAAINQDSEQFWHCGWRMQKHENFFFSRHGSRYKAEDILNTLQSWSGHFIPQILSLI